MTTKTEVIRALQERMADPTISKELFDELNRRLQEVQKQ